MTAIERILGTKQFTGWHMLGVLFLFFGTIISVNLTLAYFANSSWTGLVVKNSYVESQRFNEVTAEKLKQAELGWTGETVYENDTFAIRLADAKGEVISGAIVTARLGRPAFDAEDRTLQLQDHGGAYSAPTGLAPGIWEADISVTGPRGEVWTKAYRFLVKD